MSETILKDLELVEVEYNDSKKKATLSFVDRENGELREVNLNKQVYVNEKWVDDEAKTEKVEGYAKEYFNTDFLTLDTQIGTKHDIYAYDDFCALYHIDQVEKFNSEQKGLIFNTQIKEILDDGIALRIRYEIDDTTYETKYTYAKYLESTKEWLPNPNEKKKKLKKFEDTFNVPFENSDELIGKDIMVEVQVAFKKFYYGEIKKLPR